jgi:magnesium transporter
MLTAYATADGHLHRLPPEADLAAAVWIDLERPDAAEVARVTALGITVPTLEDMEEIELSARLYREGGAAYGTVVLPGQSEAARPVSGPVTFVVTPARLVTVRHHAPRPFQTYPDRAARVAPGCADGEHLFLSLLEEIVGRQADILEGSGRALDTVAAQVYHEVDATDPRLLKSALQRIGRETEQIGRVRLSLLTLERALGFFGQGLAQASPPRGKGDALRPAVKGLVRDINALEVHADFLSSRVSMATEATLGMINLSQNQTIKIVSVVAVVFLPPTVIASAYGMNFERMPELAWAWGYPMALGLMLASAVGTYLFFRWRKWL